MSTTRVLRRALFQEPSPPNSTLISTKPAPDLSLQDNFRDGDLLFGLGGLAGHRHQIYCALKRKKHYDFIIANDLNYPVIPHLIQSTTPKAYFSASQKEHFDFLNHHRSYVLKAGGRPVPQQAKNPVIGVAYRRACKLLVTSAIKESRVHFELSGIDMARVCARKPDDMGVTNSELRALYKHVKAHGKNPHVFFYEKGVPCEAPWDNPVNRHHWNAYDQYRAEKLKVHPYGPPIKKRKT